MLTDVRGRPRPPAALTRRTVLGGAAALAASLLGTACTSEAAPVPDITTTPQPEPEPDDAVRQAVAGQEAELIALYDATLTAHPGLAAVLAPIRAEHAEHATAMGVPPGDPLPVTAAPTPGQALVALIEAEQQAIGLRTTACEACTDTDLARTTALIAASEAGHVEFLRGVT
jgi:hypothetical protein